MQYMLLIYDDEKAFAKMPQAQIGKLMQEYGKFTQSIVKSGHFRAGSQLQPTSTTTTVREKNGKRVTTDGPYAETKEQLGGYSCKVNVGELHRREEIWGLLGYTERTIKAYVSNLFRKTGVHNRSGLASYAILHGVVPASGEPQT